MKANTFMGQDKVYTLRWYGSFESIEEVGAFEKTHPDIDCKIYMFHGYKKSAKINESYYCGQATKGVYKRLMNQGHHIYELSRISGIWIGSISNTEPQKEDINYVENLLTAELRDQVGEKSMLNEINMNFPKYNIYIINVWNRKKNLERIQRYTKYSLPDIVPDLIGSEYYTDPTPHKNVFGSNKIKWLNITF